MHASGASRREIAKSCLELEYRHCERSEAIHLPFFTQPDGLLRFASLAMTALLAVTTLRLYEIRSAAKYLRTPHSQPSSSGVPSLRAQRSNPYLLSSRGEMDCFASLAMTALLAKYVRQGISHDVTLHADFASQGLLSRSGCRDRETS